jgi:hypothetical protein
MSDPDDTTAEPPAADPPTSTASDVQAEILAAMDGSTLAEAEGTDADGEAAAGDDAEGETPAEDEQG